MNLDKTKNFTIIITYKKLFSNMKFEKTKTKQEENNKNN